MLVGLILIQKSTLTLAINGTGIYFTWNVGTKVIPIFHKRITDIMPKNSNMYCFQINWRISAYWRMDQYAKEHNSILYKMSKCIEVNKNFCQVKFAIEFSPASQIRKRNPESDGPTRLADILAVKRSAGDTSEIYLSITRNRR